MNPKNIALIFLLLLVLVIFGCTGNPSKTGSGLMTLDSNKIDSNLNSGVFNNLDDFRKVKVGDNVSVHYTLRFTDGTIFESSVGKSPFTFTVGAEDVIKGFNNAVVGMKVGEKKTVTLLPADAYGEYDIRNVQAFDANEAPQFSQLKVGDKVNTNYGPGIIIEKTDTNLVVDFNSKLAGKTLIFDIELISIN